MDIENAHQPEGNWTQIPNSIILSGELTPTDKAVFLVLLYKESYFVQHLQKKNFYCTKPKLSQLTGVSERTILDSLNHLQALGFLKVKRNKRERAANQYNLDWSTINAYKPKEKTKVAREKKETPTVTVTAPVEVAYHSTPTDWLAAVGRESFNEYVESYADNPLVPRSEIEEALFSEVRHKFPDVNKEEVINKLLVPAVRKYKDAAFA